MDVLLSSGDLPHETRHVSGIEAAAQAINIRLQTFFGEWFLDTSEGLPFLAWLQQKPPQVAGIVAAIRQEIERVPGVRVLETTSVYAPTSQDLTFTFKAEIDGEEVVIEASPVGSEASGSGNSSAPWARVITSAGAI